MKPTVAVAPEIVIGSALTIPLDGHVGGGGAHVPFVAVIVRGGAGLSPLPHFATSCTFTMTLLAAPAEKLPENEKPLSLPKWPLPTCVYEPPLSYDAQTRTSGFVRDVVDASLPFHAVAV